MRMDKAGLIACVAATFICVPAQAAPTISPSVIGAARYKNAPPRGWIRHYLGDDRYKIAGKVWKFVSTERDQYFYPPWAPEMLRQSANTVIGFSSAEDAMEAGYAPASKYRSQLLPDYLDRAEAGTKGVTTVNRGGKPKRITLADGRSTVLLPPNWKRTQSGALTLYGTSTLSDTLKPLKGRGYIRFSIVQMPAGFPADRIFRPDTFQQSIDNMRRSGGNSQAMAQLDKFTVARASLGGIEGVALTIKPGQTIDGFSGRGIIAARGQTVYSIDDEGRGVPGATVIVNSFQPR